MQSGVYIRSSNWRPASAGSQPVMRLATSSVFSVSGGEELTFARNLPSSAISTRGAAPSFHATSETRRPLRLSALGSLSLRSAAAGPARFEPEAPALAAKDAALEAESEDEKLVQEAEPSPAETGASTRKNEEVRLEIESLKYYEVLKPIPVIVRPLGDRTFEAEVAELNISTTGSSIMGVFLSMKSQIVSIVDRYRGKKMLSPEEQRHLAAFEKYIGSARRHWYAR